MVTKEKGKWMIFLFILSGLVIGGLLGDLASKIDWLGWLSFGEEFGLENPIILNLNVVIITFALMIKINIASIVGVIVALLIYKKI